MKLKYIIEIIVAIASGYCAWYLCDSIPTIEPDDVIFHIFGVGCFILFIILCIGDIVEDIYYSHK